MNESEEMRKIQFTGKSSYIVTLPKEWITDLGLERGDRVRITRKGATALEIHPSSSSSKHEAGSPKKEEAVLEIGIREESSSIVRKIISLYFLGFKSITIKPKGDRLSPGQRSVVKESIKKMLMGSEITSDSSSEIKVQVLVNMLELSVDGAFKRMIHLAKSMCSDAILAVRENNADLAKEVINTDDEVDRFGFYIIRQLKIAIQNDHILKEIGFRNARACLGYRLVVKNIERTGDHAALIAQDVLEFDSSIGEVFIDKIQEMNQFCLRVLDDACLAMFKEDYMQAEQTIKKCTEIASYEKDLLKSVKKIKNDEELYRIRRMSENIRRIAEYASDISEIVLNMNIEKALKNTGSAQPYGA